MKLRMKSALTLSAAALTLLLAAGGFLLPGVDARPVPPESAVSSLVSSSSPPVSSGVLSSEDEPSSEEELSSEEAPSSEEESTAASRAEKAPAVSAVETPPAQTQKPPAPSSQPAAPPASSAPAPVVPTPPAQTDKLVVGYYSSWASSSGLPPSKISASYLTHINYAFADVGTDYRLRLANPTTDKKNFEGLRALKQANPHLKTLISVGGWDYSSNFSAAAASASSRQTFAQSAASFMAEHGFDGVDLDWEFPKSADRANFTKLLQALRDELDRQGAADGRYYLLTIAGSPSKSILADMDAAAVASLVDYIFIMGYDIHGPWDKYADLNAPLYPTGDASPHYSLSLSESIGFYHNAGVPSSKLVLGLPFYGYAYRTDGSRADGLYAPFSSSKSVGYDTLRSSYLNAGYTSYFHSNARVPYLYDGATFVSYDDESSIAEKAAFARDQGLAGIGAWELSHDKNALLLGSAWNALNA